MFVFGGFRLGHLRNLAQDDFFVIRIKILNLFDNIAQCGKY